VNEAMSKYDPLGTFLRNRDANETPMTFAEIERVLGFSLPPKAQNHPAWWSNNPSNNTMTKVWLDAGYRTERVNVAARKLVFVRQEKKRTAPSAGPIKQEGWGSQAWPVREGHHPAYGALAGTVKIPPGVDLTKPADPDWGIRAYGDEDKG
jgi:hypothetical protein